MSPHSDRHIPEAHAKSWISGGYAATCAGEDACATRPNSLRGALHSPLKSFCFGSLDYSDQRGSYFGSHRAPTSGSYPRPSVPGFPMLRKRLRAFQTISPACVAVTAWSGPRLFTDRDQTATGCGMWQKSFGQCLDEQSFNLDEQSSNSDEQSSENSSNRPSLRRAQSEERIKSLMRQTFIGIAHEAF